MIFLVLLLFNIQYLFCQYNYGLEVISQDAKIEGKLNLNDEGQSIFIGLNSGIHDDGTDNGNVFLGYLSGQNNVDGNSNVFMGQKSGLENLSGTNNVFLGSEAGQKNTTGFDNVFVGQDAGILNTEGFNNVFIGNDAGRSNETGNFNISLGAQSAYNLTKGEKNTYIGYGAALNNSEGSRNVFIGYQAGENELLSDKLYIDNSNTNRPLIYGDFLNNDITINGTLHITEIAQLKPIEQPSACNTIDEVGTLYYDMNLDGVYVCTRASGWQAMN